MRAAAPWSRIILGTVALVGLFGVLLATLYRYNLRFDLTAERRYSLSPHARQILAALTEDVKLLAFLRSQNPRNPYIRDLLRRVANRSSRVHWEEVDVNRSPARAHEYGVTSYGAIVVKSGPRQRVVVNPREETLIWAILQVTRPEAKTVYFVAGHGEKTPAERDRLRGYSMAAVRVEEEFYRVRMLALPRVDGVPEDATVLIIAGPRGVFSPAELAHIDDYLRRGGRLLVLLDPVAPSALEAYLAKYGVIVRQETIVDPENRMLGGELVTMRLPVAAGAHAITNGMAAAPLFSLARPVEPGPAAARAEVLSVLQTGPGSWATPARGVLASGTPRFVAGRDRLGPITVGVEVRLPAPAGSREAGGRLIVYGNSEFASNFFLERDGNADLLLNTINWLADERALIGPRRPRKEPGREQLLVLGEQGAMVFWVAVVLQPGLCLLVGLALLWRQRYAS
jgi:ABC-type uncharacterized transport system involved in gliding motility auxiliary subunit